MSYPVLHQTVLDTMDVRGLAEFYRELLGYRYRDGDAPPADGAPDATGQDWVVLVDDHGTTRLAFQHVDVLPPATWPVGEHPQQLHLDLRVPTRAALDEQSARAASLGARLLLDQADDPGESLRVYADPAGHPFCLFVRELPS